MLKKRLCGPAGPYLSQASIFNERFNQEREIRIPLEAVKANDFWLSLRGFKLTQGSEFINKETLYEILEHKVIIKQLLIDRDLVGADHLQKTQGQVSV